MRAMVLAAAGTRLSLADLPAPAPAPGQVAVRVLACGVCRTDLHVVDGELPDPKLPLVPGHQIVAAVESLGEGVRDIAVGDRVGIPWLGGTCGTCRYCTTGAENLCDAAVFTGYRVDGGFAERAVADAAYCFPLDPSVDPVATAPLLCAGFIGYRALRMTGGARRLGLYGFGAAAHIVTQIARYQRRRVFALTRRGDTEAQRLATLLGAEWAGASDAAPPERLDAAIIFAPVGRLVVDALDAVDKGGVVVCAGIHMSDIPSFPYEKLWGERVLRSVANLTRRDGRELLALAPKVPVRTQVTPYPLEAANEALDDLRAGRVSGAAVVVP